MSLRVNELELLKMAPAVAPPPWLRAIFLPAISRKAPTSPPRPPTARLPTNWLLLMLVVLEFEATMTPPEAKPPWPPLVLPEIPPAPALPPLPPRASLSAKRLWLIVRFDFEREKTPPLPPPPVPPLCPGPPSFPL